MVKIFSFKWHPAIPALPLMLVVVLASTPIILADIFNLSYLFSTPICALFFGLILKSLKNYRRDITLALLAIISSLIATHQPAEHLANFSDKKQFYTQIRAKVDNVHYHHDELSWAAPERMRAVLKLQEIFHEGKWQPCQGLVQLNYDEEMGEFSYGEIVEIEGAAFRYEIESDALFNYGLHLKYVGITHFMRLDKFVKIAKAKGIDYLLSKIYLFRDKLIARASNGISDERDRKLLASMFFGYKGLLDPAEKEVFTRSGTIHLFAVSGLHVGIVAAIFWTLLGFCQMSPKPRTISLLSILFIYVIMTGSPPSAVRALVMISIWATARGFMLPSNGLNNLSLAAFILVLMNPLNLISAGFYFTFIITAFLIITYNNSVAIYQNLIEKGSWMGRSGWNSGFKFKLFQLLSCSLVASLSTFGLNILINGRVIPLAFVVNMAASFLAWLSFVIAILSITGLSIFYNSQEIILDALRYAAIQGEYSWAVKANLVVVVIFYLLLFSLPYFRHAKTFKICGLFLLLLIPIMAIPQTKNQLSLGVDPGSNVATIFVEYENKNYLINCASSKIMPQLFHEKIDSLILPDLRADHVKYLEKLLANAEIGEILIFRKPTAHFTKILQNSQKEHLLKIIDSHPLIENFKMSDSGYEFSFTDKSPSANNLTISLSRNELGTSALSISENSTSLLQETIAYHNAGFLKKIAVK